MARNRTIVIAALVFCSGPLAVFGYNDNMHERMSAVAANNSRAIAGNQPFSDWGLSQNINAITFPRTRDGQLRLVIELISQDGAIDEDRLLKVLNHFHDPFLNIPLMILVPLGEKSPDWAIAGAGQQDPFSYADARKAMELGLKSRTPADRDKNLGLMFEGLGHVIHHIQDMAQPQHVRNEMHLTLQLDKREVFPTYSRYEKWADEKFASIPMDGYDSVRLDAPRAYWTSSNSSSGNGGGGTGIADFTNANFVTQRRNFQMVDDLLQPAPPYPGPVPYAIYSEPIKPFLQSVFGCPRKNEINPNPTSQDARCSLKGEIDFVWTVVSDQLRPETNDINPRAAMYSFLNQDLERAGVTIDNGEYPPFFIPSTQQAFTVNGFTFPDAAQRLVPRAVGYSAGLIDYFFRGKIDLVPHLVDGTPDGTFDFKNLGDEPLTGTVQLYYDDVNGNRFPVVSDGWPLSIANLPRCVDPQPACTVQAPPITQPTLPAPAKLGVYMMIFTGTMGSELPMAGGPGAVAAKLVKIPLPEFYWSDNFACVDVCDIYNPVLGQKGFAELSFMLTPEQDVYFRNNVGAAHVKINGVDFPPQIAPVADCGLPNGTFPLALRFGGDTSTSAANGWSAMLSADGEVLYTNEEQGTWRDPHRAPNFATVRSAEGGVNTYPLCANQLKITSPVITQNVGVEYFLGNRSLFRFCLREELSDFQTTLGFTTVLSHMTGVRVADGAVNIRVDTQDTAGCTF